MDSENICNEQQVSDIEPVVSNSEQTPVSEEAVNKEETELQENSVKDETIEQENPTEENPIEAKEEINLSEVNDKDKASDVLKEKGFDYAKLQEEFNQTGQISKETRESLAQAGISNEVINNYIEGQQAKVEAKINEIAQEAVGGRKQMDTIVKWASSNLSDEEKSSINAVKDETIMKIILKNLKERMEEKEGKTPEYITGEGAKTQVNIYESKAQMMADIRDPRYYKDEAYMNKVKNKIEASVGAGTIKL